jgi:hypothetical protein
MWSLAAVLFTSLVIGLTGVRPDLGAAFAEPTFVLRALFLLGIALISVFSAFRLSVPGETKRWIDSAPAIAVSAFLILLVYVFFASDTRPPAYSYSCVRNVLAFSLPTSVLLYLMLRRAAPMKPGLVGMIASLGSAALSSLGTEFVCRHDDAAHVFVSHFLPFWRSASSVYSSAAGYSIGTANHESFDPDPVRPMPELIDSKEIYAGKVFDLRLDQIREDGIEYSREIVVHHGSAVIIPVFDDGTVALVRQYRHAAGKYLLEIPAGSLNDGEDPEAGAIRELEEEIGVKAAGSRS